MKVVLAGSYPQGTWEAFRGQLPEPDFQVEVIEAPEDYEQLADADCIILRVFKAPREVIERNRNLRLICRWGAGFDSVDIQAAAEHGVLVTNTPGANAHAVSELAVLLMLAVGRNLLGHYRCLRQGVWSKNMFADASTSLFGKTVALLGAGNIGRLVAQKVQAMGAIVRYYDPIRMPTDMEHSLDLEYAPLDELLPQADIVSLHLPLTAETRHIIGREQFEHMKQGAILVNTARGGLIDEDALTEALNKNRLAGAGLDCTELEPLPHNHPFLDHPKVVITPHVGGATSDIRNVMVPMIAENIRRLAAGEELTAVVNRELLNRAV